MSVLFSRYGNRLEGESPAVGIDAAFYKTHCTKIFPRKEVLPLAQDSLCLGKSSQQTESALK